MDNKLFRNLPDQFGNEYIHIYFEQYKLFVEMADRITQRRASANNYMISINAFLTSLYSLSEFITDNSLKCLCMYLIPIAGITICLTWFALIQSYRNLNKIKFHIINKLEDKLPIAMYDYEWILAERGTGKVYCPISHIDQIVPFVFICIYIIIAIVFLLLI